MGRLLEILWRRQSGQAVCCNHRGEIGREVLLCGVRLCAEPSMQYSDLQVMCVLTLKFCGIFINSQRQIACNDFEFSRFLASHLSVNGCKGKGEHQVMPVLVRVC